MVRKLRSGCGQLLVLLHGTNALLVGTRMQSQYKIHDPLRASLEGGVSAPREPTPHAGTSREQCLRNQTLDFFLVTDWLM